ncbi:MAG: hypothetical protein QM687_15090 [Ferruginibacter sp.]
MNDQNSTTDFQTNDFDGKKLPGMLNVLTILTFIGCGIGLLFTLATPKLMSFSKEMMQKASASGQEMTAKEAEKMQKAMEQIDVFQANMIPLIVIGLAGIALCLVGAIMMRKLKKDGFWLYVAGQAIPFISSAVILGAGQFKEIGNIFFLAIAVAFVALYATQRKYLTK